MGDPAGIGPEICLRAIADLRVLASCRPVVFGSANILRCVAAQCDLPLRSDILSFSDWLDLNTGATGRAESFVVDVGTISNSSVQPGRVQKGCGRAAYKYIKAAVDSALTRRVIAVATAPINKESLRLADIPYPGHTEMLAAFTGIDRYCMMMTSRKITVSLATTHIPYADVPDQLSEERIVDTISLTVDAMRKLGKPRPRIVVCGLNPHAGENGLFGSEETAIRRAVQRARRKGVLVTGPLPADTAFIPSMLGETDAYVAMYHDQGLIPFKMLSFDTGVNVTLGLPIVRTSVDHGTAFDVAWKGKASPDSLVESIILAARLGASIKPPVRCRRAKA
ncbi:MAG: 4-hydroxythreonine-4-phosphate dehydrogenase PdxA [Verrucomicrobia bacterium]|nr:4-hydroxythreonine-4-phosphate dehydrogenase PdxA [Verrucomicrobiota bacterium]